MIYIHVLIDNILSKILFNKFTMKITWRKNDYVIKIQNIIQLLKNDLLKKIDINFEVKDELKLMIDLVEWNETIVI